MKEKIIRTRIEEVSEDKEYTMFLFLTTLVKPEAVNDKKMVVDSFDREWDMLVNWYFDNHVLR